MLTYLLAGQGYRERIYIHTRYTRIIIFPTYIINTDKLTNAHLFLESSVVQSYRAIERFNHRQQPE